MRPALQRLLARPSSLDLIRALVGTPTGPATIGTTGAECEGKRGSRKYSTCATAFKESQEPDKELDFDAPIQRIRSEQHIVKPAPGGLSPREGFAFDPRQLLQAGDAFLFFDEETTPDIDLGAKRKEDKAAPSLDRALWTGDCLKDDYRAGTEEDSVPVLGNLTGISRLDKSESPNEAKIGSKIQHTPHLELAASTRGEVVQEQTPVFIQSGIFGPWEKQLSSHKRLEFESSLEMPVTSKSTRRLVDTKAHKDDLRLWASLLTYRKRVYGREGVLMFWNAIRRRDIHLSCSVTLGDAFWPIFLDLGFENASILKQVCDLADSILERSGERWHDLYSYVIQHFLIHDNGPAAIFWHRRLFSSHPPGANRFARMCRKVTFQRGDLQALKIIYKETGYTNAYSKIIPVLCAREEYKSASEWHYMLLKQGDLPSTPKLVEPLAHFLAIYFPPQATKLTKSLVDAGVSFAPTLPTQLEINTKISREMMNLVHGEDLNVPPKKYSDSLGARWFATTWVSVDTAISTVHALGVREIGPLSLQAIALRDPDPASIMMRIKQIQDLGISIGKSLFSRAIEHFANPRNRREDCLKGLLNSDQHPDELENGELQEALLATYAQAKDWTQYRRTIEIRSLASRAPRIESANIILRGLILRRNMPAIFNHLEDMQLQHVPVKTFSAKILLRHILHQRSPGKRPSVPIHQVNRGISNDLDIAIAVLRKIMTSGSYVPVTQWREIVRRLGMLGRFQDLQALCIFLAEWYGPKRMQKGRYCAPLELSTNHPLHPLSMLFSPSLQKALVEWGFIAALKREPQHKLYASHKRFSAISDDPSALPDVVAGVKLLKKLAKLGVRIHGPVVRKGILNRLVAYFGPGRSSRRHNRWGQERLAGRMAEVAEKIDRTLGGVYFSSTEIDLEAKVKRMALLRMEKTTTRRLGMRNKRHRRHTLDPRLLQLPRLRANIGRWDWCE